MFSSKNPQRIEKSLEILGLPKNIEEKELILNNIIEYIFSINKEKQGFSTKKIFDINFDYKYYFPDFLKYGINLNKEDIDWWEFNSILNAILNNENSNMSKILKYRTYEKSNKNEKTRATLYHQQMMKLKREYALPNNQNNELYLGKLWDYLEKKAGDKKV